jgi:predicted NACHT family NTPase
MKEETQNQAEKLIRQVRASRALSDLARNPLLLTMIANTHLSSPDLPKRRVELYDRICNLLLGTRPNTKRTYLTLTTTQNRRVLQILALNLVQREVTQFTPQESVPWIEDCLEACCQDPVLSPQAFLLEIVQVSRLVVEKEFGAYEFSHQTFQEYLAAVQLREMGSEEEVLVGEQRENDRWQEVIVLYAAQGDASSIIEKLLDNPTAYRLKLAIRCRDEGREVSRAAREQKQLG